MDLHVPDPAYIGSQRARAHFRLAVRIASGFVALLWLIFAVDVLLDIDPGLSGIRPRRWDGIPGIVFAPLVHASFAHLVSNTLPLLVLGTALLFLYPRSALRVVPAIYFGIGMAVWLLGRDSVHFGASGLVYGLVAFVLVAGLLRRDRRAAAASLLVFFMYGSLAWGLAPIQEGVSWETHLTAALIGLALALALRHFDTAPRKHYAWEGEEERESGAPSQAGEDS